jgi:asparagine synthase (glutamine-hydrolysing)
MYRKLIRARASPSSSASDSNLVSNIVNSFEREYGPSAYGDDTHKKVPVSNGLVSDSELSYILRSLLLRNDAMGMAASVEARFPFLDSRLVKFSVNLPSGCKIRFSLRAFDGKHIFYRDKWIIREVAGRYLPRSLSARAKGQFPTNAFDRMRIGDQLFDRSFAGDLLGITPARFSLFLRKASPSLKLRLMLLQSWWQVCILGVEREHVRAKLAEHVKVSA